MSKRSSSRAPVNSSPRLQWLQSSVQLRSIRGLLCAGLFSLTSLCFGAESSEASAEDPPLPPMPPSGGAATSPSSQRASTSPSNGAALTAEEALRRALEANPTLLAAELNLLGAREQVRAEQGRYPFAVLADGSFSRTESPQLRADDSVASSTTRSIDASLALKKPFASGGSAELRATEQHFNRDILAVTVSPFLPANSGHAAIMKATVTQPFLRGFGTEVGEVELRAAESSRRGAVSALARTRSALARDVLTSYYELWYAHQALEIDLASLELARKQEQQTSERVVLGELALSENLTFQTRTAELQESVVSSRLNVTQRAIALRQLMGEGEFPDEDILPVTPPPISGDVPPLTALTAAFADDSVELAEIESQLRTAEIRATVAGDAVRPRLDATAYVQANGVSESVGNAWARAAGLDWWTAYVGVSVELPTDMSRQSALAAQARANAAALRAQVDATRSRIAADAMTAWSTATAANERIASAEKTLAIAEKAHEAAVGRFELGQASAISVQQAEEDLRRARLRVVRARVDVAQQRTNLAHLTGKLLASLGSPR